MKNFKKKTLVLLSLIVFVCFGCVIGGYASQKQMDSDSIKITILYDNYLHTEGTKTDWGFSCLIEGTEKTILFDAGTRSDILMHNIEKLDIDINKIEQIVISHDHGDHYGGLLSASSSDGKENYKGLLSHLRKNHALIMYIPISFRDVLVDNFKAAGAEITKVKEPLEICKDVLLTGEMGGPIKEHALILNTSKGLVVITGCAHPGIAGIVKKAKDILNKNVYFVLGGFHLLQKSDAEVMEIIDKFKESGVIKCGATHCTGDRQIEIFKEVFGDNYVGMGVGKVIKISK